MTWNYRFIFAAITVFASASEVSRAEKIPFSADTLDHSAAKSVSFKTVRGRQALCLDRGVVLVKNQVLEKGSIIVDIENTHHRHFASLLFNAKDEQTHESAYLRMHKNRQPDAIQYTPHINGETNWQLFGKQQASADFGDADWVTLQVDFNRHKAMITIKASGTSYQLPISNLALGDAGSKFGMRALFPTCFSNLRVSKKASDLSKVPEADAQLPSGWIEYWRLSDAESFVEFSSKMIPKKEWEKARTELNGTLMVSKYRRKNTSGNYERNALDVVYAGAWIHSDSIRTVPLNFDVSDIGRVYLNGEPIVEINNSFMAKGNALFRGDFDASKQTVLLKLKPGINPLVIGVAEKANGWGLAAKLTDMSGLSIE